ncbi:MAG: hypothetical protein K6L75_04905 [Cellvibrionaceae bacterium]
MSSNKMPESDAFFTDAIRTNLLKNTNEADRLRGLSDGLEWVKAVIDSERERQLTSKLLTLKLLYAGYFGSKGRSTKYARNPCAIRDALKFCRANKIPPPDWTLQYIYDLMSGQETPPTERDERRWKNLMKLLDLAAEWDKKASQGLSEEEIERFFRKKGIATTPLQYAKAFLDPQEKKPTFDLAKTLGKSDLLKNDSLKEKIEEMQQIAG